MAKAVAICRCKTCGNEFTATAIKNNRREADKWEGWAPYNLFECDDCREKRIKAERESEAQKCAELAKEANLPELKGSPKQVAWAEQIRMGFATRLDEFIQGLITSLTEGKSSFELRKKVEQSDVDTFRQFREWILATKDSAKFWIDGRFFFDGRILRSYTEFRFDFDRDMEAKRAEEVAEETTVTLQPEEQQETVVCTVEYTEKEVTVKSKYSANMPPVVKGRGYKWDRNRSVWWHAISFATGSAEDRAAEIANALLVAGFPVRIDKALAERAANGDYEPEHLRWISRKIKTDLLVVEMERDNDDLEKKARRISGSSAYGPITIPVSSWEEVEEFARLYDFRLSPGAAEAIEKFKSSLVKTSVKAGEQAVYAEEDVKAIMNSSRDVLDDLKEEDA